MRELGETESETETEFDSESKSKSKTKTESQTQCLPATSTVVQAELHNPDYRTTMMTTATRMAAKRNEFANENTFQS